MSEQPKREHRVTFQPSGVVITCSENQTLAAAALAQRVILPVSCENGVCQICQGQLVAGHLRFRNDLGEAILEYDNQVLCCIAYPQSDVEIVMTDVFAPDHKPSVTLACQVSVVEALADDMHRFVLLAPAGKQPNYWAGQYLMLHIDIDGVAEKIPYSIANAPGGLVNRDPREIELHIAGNSDKAWQVINTLKASLVVHVTLPMGSCIINESFLHETAQQPLLMVAAGSGFSQIKALIEATLAIEPNRDIHLYWSNRAAVGFYMAELPLEWAKDNAHFHYHPIIQEHADDWNGRAGWIYEVIHEDFENLSQAHMFACGSPNMVFGTLEQLEPLGMLEAKTHSDVFAYATRPIKS